MAQFRYYQIKSFLHLSFMLESSTDQRVEYSRIACFDAARKLLGLYHVMRSRDDEVGFDKCKVIDFQGFTAAVLLLLGLLGYGRNSSAQDLQQQESDWHLIEITREIIRRVLAEEGNSVAVQSLEVLELLSTIRCGNGSEGASQDPKWEAKLAIPCFGTITISRGVSFSKSAVIPSGRNRQGFPETDMKGNRNEMSDSRTFRTGAAVAPTADEVFEPDISYPHIDINWQNMTNVDLDEDWGRNVGGMSM